MTIYEAVEFGDVVWGIIYLFEMTIGFAVLEKLFFDKRLMKEWIHAPLAILEILIICAVNLLINAVMCSWKGCEMLSISLALAKNITLIELVPAAIIFPILIFYVEKTERRVRENTISEQSIYEAFNDLPDGICVARKNGMPVLTNDRFYEVFEDLSRTLFRNTREVEGLVKEEKPLVLTDGSVWEFRQKEMTVDGEQMTEISAFDITRLYVLSKEIQSKNRSLESQNQRLGQLMANIASVQREEEILASRVRIHDELGQVILMTRMFLAGKHSEDEENAVDFEDVIREWNRVITMLGENMADVDPVHLDNLQALEHAADAVGCRIQWKGKLPENEETVSLILQLVRETLMNAVHYGNAENLFVEIEKLGGKSFVTITDDGEGAPNGVTERGGLKNMRQKIERRGGIMEVDTNDGVVITMVLP